VGFDFPGRSWGGRKHQIQGGLPGIKFISKLYYEPDRKVLKGGKWDLIFLGGRGVGGNIKSRAGFRE